MTQRWSNRFKNQDWYLICLNWFIVSRCGGMATDISIGRCRSLKFWWSPRWLVRRMVIRKFLAVFLSCPTVCVCSWRSYGLVLIHRNSRFRYPAVIVEVEGHAFYSGISSFTYEAEDSFKDGFLVKWSLIRHHFSFDFIVLVGKHRPTIRWLVGRSATTYF